MIAKHPPASSDETPGADRKPISVGARRFLWIFSIAMVLTAGTAFLFKLIEFLYSLTRASNTVAGGEGLRPGFFFAISPLITYLIVATGFACLFLWAYFSGQFKDVEGPKYRMLELQKIIDRAEAGK